MRLLEAWALHTSPRLPDEPATYGKDLAVSMLAHFLHNKPLAEITPADIQAFAHKRWTSQQGSPHTRRSTLKYLRRAFDDLQRAGLVAHNPVKLAFPRRRARRPAQPLTIAEYERILAQAQAEGARNEAIVRLLAAGLTITALRELTSDDLHPQGVYVRGTKRLRLVPLASDTVALLQQLAAAAPAHGFLFRPQAQDRQPMSTTSISLLVGDLSEAAGVPASAQDLRAMEKGEPDA